jgi:hypothetical protein
MATDLQPSSAGDGVRVPGATRVPSMPEQLNLSQSAWALLDLLQQQLGVTLEVLDSSMRPLSSATGVEPTNILDQPSVAAEISKSMKSGEVRIDRTSGAPVGIFPLRVSRQVAGCLLVLPRSTRLAGSETLTDARIEGTGYLGRTALESDLALTGQLGDARFRNRRGHGVLRFLLQLGAQGCTEAEMMNAVVQAATVWFDADCRIYQRQPDGGYVLAARLPGAEHRGSPRIDAMRAEKLVASRRFRSAGDLEELGMAGRRDEVLVLPVGEPHPQWLLVLAGAIDQEIDLTFSAIVRILAGVLQSRDMARVERWQQKLAAVVSEPHRAPERVILSLLESLATEVGAVGARVTLVNGGEDRALAALGQTPKPVDDREPQGSIQDDRISETLDVTGGKKVRVTLWPGPGPARSAGPELRSWVTALRPWLHDVVVSLNREPSVTEQAVASAFEQRIQEEVERAKRFNLGLGLVVIGVAKGPTEAVLDDLIDAVRPDLRASDLTGRLGRGFAAILLVHTESVGADTVLARLRQRLESIAPDTKVRTVRLGKAVFTAENASADALIAEAIRTAQRLELRS